MLSPFSKFITHPLYRISILIFLLIFILLFYELSYPSNFYFILTPNNLLLLPGPPLFRLKFANNIFGSKWHYHNVQHFSSKIVVQLRTCAMPLYTLAVERGPFSNRSAEIYSCSNTSHICTRLPCCVVHSPQLKSQHKPFIPALSSLLCPMGSITAFSSESQTSALKFLENFFSNLY